tara:strand:+ start:579 stop:863 length:285 start_codon:yes stop_codon:yes gene_type:complete
MATKNVQQLLTEQLGKNRCDVITTTTMAGKDYYAIHFVTESVISEIGASNIQTGTGSSPLNLHTTIAAGTTLFLNVTTITLTSGLAICYYDQIV